MNSYPFPNLSNVFSFLFPSIQFFKDSWKKVVYYVTQCVPYITLLLLSCFVVSYNPLTFKRGEGAWGISIPCNNGDILVNGRSVIIPVATSSLPYLPKSFLFPWNIATVPWVYGKKRVTSMEAKSIMIIFRQSFLDIEQISYDCEKFLNMYVPCCDRGVFLIGWFPLSRNVIGLSLLTLFTVIRNLALLSIASVFIPCL